jgi:type-F conjugative transfer system pilin assembly thiol-disulfide isomerase TrbB
MKNIATYLTTKFGNACLGLLVMLMGISASNAQLNVGQSQASQAFVLFYMASCPHCRNFDPVLRRYAEEHHIPVLAYTLDKESLPSFPNSFTPSAEELLKFFPRNPPVVPTLFLMDSDRHKIIPVSQGEASTQQLDERLNQIRGKGVSHVI